ncbi:TetR/AcrR family transcriptional regulator [Nocardia sp. NBC_01503]|uniref:TetR/AcrR family transcriptional regulator n=1 Tax=Nocardia sp. NBC_01503 TaxID=2975997 RepID=UPI002E7BB3D5|nr:TetR/AcrR family transcriptional regulator [Nocardia sp. NBC_01503]WTL35564.1 TetR/AcrR family transcriptional regulator [Nocardia sp. NBC_01503]
MNVVEPLRERLVSAGVDMLEQVGAGQLGLRAIAREAGVSHGAPRRWFPTHNSLLAAIAARGYADLGARLEAIQGDSPRERLDRTCRTYVEFAVERPEMFTLMFRHDLLEGAGENLRATTTLPMFRRWRDLVATASAPPTTDGNPPDTDEIALGLWTNLHGVATLVANRSLEAMAPGFDPDRLVTSAITRHLPR